MIGPTVYFWILWDIFPKKGQKDYRVSSGVLLKIEVGIR